MKCYHCEHYNIENGICDFDNCEILNPWESIDCEYLYEEKMKTIFQRITVSPEVLAPLLVRVNVSERTGIFYTSMIVCGAWNNEAEAIAATVAELKEAKK